MTSEECIAKALLEPGFRIRQEGWVHYAFIQLSGGFWVDEDGEGYDYQIRPKCIWEPYEEPAKMVTWYRPKVVWYEGNLSPHTFFANFFHKDKSSFYERDCRILTWEEIQAPETWEQVNEDSI